jgi:hypothetical protein
MAKTYYLSNTDSDLTGGADFSKELTTTAGGDVTITGSTFSVSSGSTEVSYAWTPSGDPGTNGATGNHTIEFDITTADTDIWLSCQIHRVNSSGTVQTSSSVTSEQQETTAQVYTFTFTSQSLGTWASGDRLRVDYRFRSARPHGNSTVGINGGTTDAEVVTPFTVPTTTIPRPVHSGDFY